MVKVVTHNGQFHTDEVTAIAMLEIIYDNIEIIRTRDKETLQQAINDPYVFVVDVGHSYNHDMHNYDHHQTSFNDTYSEKNTITPLSSCGLIFKHYGQQLIQALDLDYYLDPGSYQDVLNYLYKTFVQPIDANDNGVDYLVSGQHARYTPLSYGSIITKFNSDIYSDQDQATRFRSAVNYAKITVMEYVKSSIVYQIKYDQELKEFNMDMVSNGHTLILNKMYSNTSTFLSKLDPVENIKFVVFPVSDHEYRIWTRTVKGERFEVQVPLVTEIEARNLIGDKLVFVHKALFTGGTTTLDTALALTNASFIKAQVPFSWYEYIKSQLNRFLQVAF